MVHRLYTNKNRSDRSPWRNRPRSPRRFRRRSRAPKKKWGDDFSHEMRGIEPAKNGNLYDYYKIFLFLFNNIYIYPYGSKYLLRKCLGYNLEG